MANMVGMAPIYVLYTVNLNANKQVCALGKGNKKERCCKKNSLNGLPSTDKERSKLKQLYGNVLGWWKHNVYSC